MKSSIEEVDSFLVEKEEGMKEFISNLQSKTVGVSDRVDGFIVEYKETMKPRCSAKLQKQKQL